MIVVHPSAFPGSTWVIGSVDFIWLEGAIHNWWLNSTAFITQGHAAALGPSCENETF